MKKYDLLSIVGRKNKYQHILKATKEHRNFSNILNRKFRWLKAFEKLWTYISYIYYNNWIIQSMSRKWNSLDNTPTESFFGHMKD